MAWVIALIWLRIGRAGQKWNVQPTTDRYDIAYLGGGGERVVEAALVALYGMGLVKVDETQGRAQLTAEQATAIPEDLHEVEVRVLKAVPVLHTTSPQTLVRNLGPMIGEMHERLTEEGLVESKSARRRLRLVAALPFVLVMLVGIAKVFVGVERGRAVGYLVLFLAFSLILLIEVVTRVRRRTPAGEKMWKTLKKAPSVTAKSVQSHLGMGDPAQVAMLVALGGYAALHMPAYGQLHSSLHRANSDSGSGSGSCSSDSSSSSSGCSSGGSSCGSSGCGGCGGGGGGD